MDDRMGKKATETWWSEKKAQRTTPMQLYNVIAQAPKKKVFAPLHKTVLYESFR